MRILILFILIIVHSISFAEDRNTHSTKADEKMTKEATSQQLATEMEKQSTRSAAIMEEKMLKRWVEREKQKADRINRLKHNQAILELQVRNARLRSDCIKEGVNCPLVPPVIPEPSEPLLSTIEDSVPTMPQIMLPTPTGLPVVTGIVGGKVRIKDNNGENWYWKGNKYYNFHIKQVYLDYVLFSSSYSAKEIKVFVNSN